MATYYIVTQAGVIYTLDSTTDVSLTLGAKLSTKTISSGKSASDNYVLANDSVSFTGRISDIKSLKNPEKMSTEDYIQGLKDIRDKKQQFTTYFSDNQPPLKNSFFTKLDFKQNKTTGNSRGINSYTVSLSIQNIIKGRTTKLIALRSDLIKDDAEEKKAGSKVGVDGEEVSRSWLGKQGAALVKFATRPFE